MYESVRHPVGGMSFTQMCVKTQLQEVNVDDEPSTSPSIICSVFLTLLTGDTFTHWKEKNLSTAETEPNNSTDGQNFSGMHQIYIIKDANTAEVSCRRSKVCSIIGPLIHQEVLIRPPSLCWTDLKVCLTGETRRMWTRLKWRALASHPSASLESSRALAAGGREALPDVSSDMFAVNPSGPQLKNGLVYKWADLVHGGIWISLRETTP